MTRTVILAATLLAACSNAASTDRATPEGVERAESTITAADARARVAFLASDDLRGRDTPSPGLDSAAAWIARELAGLGLEPGAGDGAGDGTGDGAGDGAWIQRYPYPLLGLDLRETRFEVSGGATHTFEYGQDFFAEPGAAPDAGVGAVYLGDPGALEGAADGSLRGRAAVVRLEGRPESGRRGYRFGWDARQRVTRARALARDAGAAAVVFIMEEAITAGEVGAMAEAAATPSRSVVGGDGADDDALPAAFFLARPAAARVFRMAGLDAAEQLRRPAVERPVPLPGITLRLGAPVGRLDDATAPNVVGVLRGADPELRDSYLVLSAHMDHVGVGRPVDGDSIYNGADDDASGVAAMLEVAEAFAALPAPPRRSVLFLAVSGEEKGLLGSRWFAAHPTVPIASIVANLNLDMVGRNAPDSIVVIGQEYSSLGRAIHDVADRNPDLGLTVSEDLWPEERFFFRSDHFSFAAREIPALFFFAGTHEDYHRPGDEVERIDGDKIARVARLVFLLAHDIAESAEPPAWDPRGLEEVRRLTNRN